MIAGLIISAGGRGVNLLAPSYARRVISGAMFGVEASPV